MSYYQLRRSSTCGVLLPLLLLDLSTGCATAHSTTYRDGAYTGAAFRKIAVVARGMDLDEARQLESQVCGRLAPASCATGQSLLPPVRDYTGAEVQRALGDAEVDGVLLVWGGHNPDAAQFYRTLPARPAAVGATQHGNLALLGRTGAIPTSRTERASVEPATQADPRQAQAGLMERATGRLVWGGDVAADRRLGAPMSQNALIAAIASELATQLHAARLAR
jgi:hypothetical protein